MREAQALRRQRERIQGLGKGIISFKLGDMRFVAIGNTLHRSRSWTTFHDFLRELLVHLLGADWLKIERAKPDGLAHPIIGWTNQATEHIRKSGTVVGGLLVGPMSGAQRALLALAYNLYIIGHHARPDQSDELVARFVARLKKHQEFWGALFETYAAANFLKAGFEVDYEKERGSAVSHVEFVATYPETGKRFSVEVKTRNRSAAADGPMDEVKRLRIASKLTKALLKDAKHTRIVMIELNVSDYVDPETWGGWPETAADQVQSAEELTKPSGEGFDPAYVLITNHAYHGNLTKAEASIQCMAAGYKIPDFGQGKKYAGFYAYLKAQQRHTEMAALIKSMKEHHVIPITFDLELPELAFQAGGVPPRLKIGHWYTIPMEDGEEVPGLLEGATVLESEKTAYCIYKTEDGRRVIIGAPLTDAELAAWKAHPDIFFGQIQEPTRQCRTQLELAEFLWESYQRAPREKLLTWLTKAPDIENLMTKPDDELAAIYCERMALSMWPRKRATAKSLYYRLPKFSRRVRFSSSSICSSVWPRSRNTSRALASICLKESGGAIL